MLALFGSGEPDNRAIPQVRFRKAALRHRRLRVVFAHWTGNADRSARFSPPAMTGRLSTVIRFQNAGSYDCEPAHII